MIDLYLITGFLGSGKTTFLKEFVGLFKNKKLALVINEFGQEGVDATLLSELSATLYEINNGSIFCSCRLEQFENVLKGLIDESPDIIIVEASGLSDPTNIQKTLKERSDFENIHYCGAVCLVDAKIFPKIFYTAPLMQKQLSVSDIFIINKIDLVSNKEKSTVKELILLKRPDAENAIFETSFCIVSESLKSRLLSLTPVCIECSGRITRDISLQKFLLTLSINAKKEELMLFLKLVCENSYRIKGFVRLDGVLYFADCTLGLLNFELYEGEVPSQKEQKLVVLSGNLLETQTALKKACELYPDVIKSIE